MANEQSGSPLRRWRPFYGAIDDAVEAAGHPRAAYRDMRVWVVKMLRAATDDGVAEQLCAALDDAMAKSLETLLATPVPHSALASTDLRRAVDVDALGNHGSARIRSLASDAVRGWSVAKDGAVKKPIVAQRKKTETKKPIVSPSEKIEAKKPAAAQSETEMEVKKPVMAGSEKMETTKRKLHEGYEEAERFKHQRKIKKIDDKDALNRNKMQGVFWCPPFFASYASADLGLGLSIC